MPSDSRTLRPEREGGTVILAGAGRLLGNYIIHHPSWIVLIFKRLVAVHIWFRTQRRSVIVLSRCDLMTYWQVLSQATASAGG